MSALLLVFGGLDDELWSREKERDEQWSMMSRELRDGNGKEKWSKNTNDENSDEMIVKTQTNTSLGLGMAVGLFGANVLVMSNWNEKSHLSIKLQWSSCLFGHSFSGWGTRSFVSMTVWCWWGDERDLWTISVPKRFHQLMQNPVQSNPIQSNPIQSINQPANRWTGAA
jgi:hypothetical protein